VALVVGGVVLALRFRPGAGDASWTHTRYLLREGFPLGLGAALGLIYLQADKLILGKMLGEVPTGWYNAAYVLYFTLIEVLSTPMVVGSYPTLSRYHSTCAEDPAALDKLLGKLIYGMVLLSLPLAVGGAFTAEALLAFIYRGAYPQSGPVLAVLLWSLVLIFPGNTLSKLLIIEGQQGRVLLLRALSAGLAVPLNVALIAALGYIGPAVAIFAVQVVVNGLAVWWQRGRLPRLGLDGRLVRAGLAVLPMAAVCLVLRETHVLVTIGAAAGAYTVALVLLGALKREDLGYLRAALGR
jgi:O-antigen/teichoic acid export membrane protein